MSKHRTPSTIELRSYAVDVLLRTRNVNRIIETAATWRAAGFPQIEQNLLQLAREELAVMADEATQQAELSDDWTQVVEIEAMQEVLLG